MKKRLQIFLYLLLISYLPGCSNKDGYYNPKEFYSLTDTLKGEILSTPLPSYAEPYYNEYGIFVVTRKDNGIFQLLDSTDASLITAVGKRGRGPDEFLMGLGMQYDCITNRFSAFDLYRQELVTYQVSPDTIALIQSVNLKRDLQRVQYLNDSTLVFINFYPHQKLGLMNTRAEVIYEEEYNSLDDDRIKTEQRYHGVDMEISPDKQYTVVTDGHFPAIKVYRNIPGGFELVWKKMLFRPYYDFNASKKWYKLLDKNFSGFRNLYLTDKYIYLSCEDVSLADRVLKKPMPKHTYVLVMDYEGNIVNKYLLDRFMSIFTVTPDDKILYGQIDNPDLLIAKYKLR